MRIGGRRVPGCIRYPRRGKRLRTSSLEDNLRRVLTLGGPSPSLTTASPRRRQLIRTYQHWQRLRRSRSHANTTLILFNRPRRIRAIFPSLRSISRTNEDINLLNEQRSQIRETSLHSTSILEFGESTVSSDQVEVRRRIRMSQGRVGHTMSSQNDSLIWNNRSSDQLESTLSLVVNPPSSISQQEDSVVSEDSQYTRSSQLDLALEDERRWMKYRIENLTRDECIITCVLAQVCADIMMLCWDELPGSRDTIPSDEEAKQSLLYMSYGGCWELNNLRTVLDLAEFLPVGLRRLCGLGVRDRGSSSRKVLEGRLEQCLDLTRRLNLQQAG